MSVTCTYKGDLPAPRRTQPHAQHNRALHEPSHDHLHNASSPSIILVSVASLRGEGSCCAADQSSVGCPCASPLPPQVSWQRVWALPFGSTCSGFLVSPPPWLDGLQRQGRSKHRAADTGFQPLYMLALCHVVRDAGCTANLCHIQKISLHTFLQPSQLHIQVPHVAWASGGREGFASSQSAAPHSFKMFMRLLTSYSCIWPDTHSQNKLPLTAPVADQLAPPTSNCCCSFSLKWWQREF